MNTINASDACTRQDVTFVEGDISAYVRALKANSYTQRITQLAEDNAGSGEAEQVLENTHLSSST